MAKRKYTGTDAELLRLKREGLSLRVIAAEVGIGKSVVGARIARAEAAERLRAGPPASTQAISTPATSRAASATPPSDRHVAGPVDVRAELTRLVKDPRTGKREVLGALQQLARLDETDAPRPARWSPPMTLGVEPMPDGRWRVWGHTDRWYTIFEGADHSLAAHWLALILLSLDDPEPLRDFLRRRTQPEPEPDGSEPFASVLAQAEPE
jgi:hypothetical protein